MRMDRDPLISAVHKTKLPKIIVGYLKLQQAFNDNFFTLFLENKINGRLFYNTCLPGAKEMRYGNEDFLQDDLKNAIDTMLAPFNNVSLEQVKFEMSKPSEISEKMNHLIASLMRNIETCEDWKKFWEREIHLQCSDAEKKQLYNAIAGAAAYKALVSCIDHSSYILDPAVKRNVAVLVRNCTSIYHSSFLKDGEAFHIKGRTVADNKHKKIKPVDSDIPDDKKQSSRLRG
jgi:hypothetical protein